MYLKDHKRLIKTLKLMIVACVAQPILAENIRFDEYGKGSRPLTNKEKRNIWYSLLLTAFVSLFTNDAFSYGGPGHQMLSRGAIVALSESNCNGIVSDLNDKIDDKTVFEWIWTFASDPDVTPLTDDNINQLSNYQTYWKKAYDFNEFVTNKMGKASWGLPWSWFTDDQVVHFLSFLGGGTGINSLKCSTQHTFVQNTGGVMSASFAEITCCPFAAQAEYNLAVSALKGSSSQIQWQNATTQQKKSAVQHLGRVLHYIQDVTVPHHCEIGGNYPDLCLGYYNLTYYHVAMESGSSQTAYEQTYINNTFASNGANFTKNTIDWRANLIIDPKFISTFFPGALNARNILQNNNGLDNIVLGIRDYVAFTNFPAAPKGNFMDFVDGWANYDEDKILSDKGLASVETWVRVKCYSGYVDPYYKRCRFSCNVGVNDDQEYVANNLIPIAVKASALVIAKFFHEVKGTSISSLSSIPKDAIFYHR